MVTSTNEPAPVFEPALALPYWPFSCLTFYSRLLQDSQQCAQRLAEANDFESAIEVEQLFSIMLFRDLWQGYIDLTLCPLNAMTVLMTEYCERSIAQSRWREGAETSAEPQTVSAAGERELRLIHGPAPDE